jgi:hypothetical protein
MSNINKFDYIEEDISIVNIHDRDSDNENEKSDIDTDTDAIPQEKEKKLETKMRDNDNLRNDEILKHLENLKEPHPSAELVIATTITTKISELNQQEQKKEEININDNVNVRAKEKEKNDHDHINEFVANIEASIAEKECQTQCGKCKICRKHTRCINHCLIL